MYREALVMLSLISEFEAGHIIQAAANYFLYGKEPPSPFSEQALNVWNCVKFGIDKSCVQYDKICKLNAEKSKKAQLAREKRRRREKTDAPPAGYPADTQRTPNLELGTSNFDSPNIEPLNYSLSDEKKPPPQKTRGDETEALKKKFFSDNADALQPSQENGGEIDG